jgi:hypothetical protein
MVLGALHHDVMVGDADRGEVPPDVVDLEILDSGLSRELDGALRVERAFVFRGEEVGGRRILREAGEAEAPVGAGAHRLPRKLLIVAYGMERDRNAGGRRPLRALEDMPLDRRGARGRRQREEREERSQRGGSPHCAAPAPLRRARL